MTDISNFDTDEFREFEIQQRVKERTHQWAREFVKYVIGEAAHRVTISAVDDAAFMVLFQRLDGDGHRVGPDEPGGDPVTSVFLHPADRDDFLANIQSLWIGRDRESDAPGFQYRGSRIHADRHLDRGTVLVVHDDAVAAPPSLAASDKPWLVRDPSAVAVGIIDD